MIYKYAHVLFISFILLIYLTICVSCTGHTENNLFVAGSNKKLLSANTLNVSKFYQNVRFNNENCNGGIANMESGVCFYDTAVGRITIDTNIKSAKVTLQDNHTKTIEYPIIARKVFKIDQNIYILAAPTNVKINRNRDELIVGEFWRCSLIENQCLKDNNRKYVDMILIEPDSLDSSDRYHSIMLIAQPYFVGTTQNGSVNATIQLLNLLPIKYLDLNLQTVYPSVFNIDKLALIGNIYNDIPIASNGKDCGNVECGKIKNLSFGMLQKERVNVQFIYDAAGSAGTISQTYYPTVLFDKTLKIDDTLSSKSHNHISFFKKNMPKFDINRSTGYSRVLKDLRKATGGDNDSDENFAWCKGDSIYCNIFPLIGYDAIKNLNYTSEAMNASFMTLLSIAVQTTFSNVIGEVPAIQKYTNTSTVNIITQLIMTSGFNYFNKSITDLRETLFYWIDNLLSPNYDLENNVVYLAVLDFMFANLGSKVEISSCGKDLFIALSSIESQLNGTVDTFNERNKTLLDLFRNTNTCSSKNIDMKDIADMQYIELSSNFYSSFISYVVQRQILDKQNMHNADGEFIQEPNLDRAVELKFISILDNQEVTAINQELDFIMRTFNCIGKFGKCDTTYFQGSESDCDIRLKDSNNNPISINLGNFVQ